MDTQRGSRHILMHGLFLMMAGLVWGLVVPHTPYPRLALGAHVQFATSGVLFSVVSLLILNVPNRLGPKSIGAMILAAWLSWLMTLSEVANAWWGTTKMLPLAAGEAGATGAQPWQETVVMGTHIAAGLMLIVAWALLIAGFLRAPKPQRA